MKRACEICERSDVPLIPCYIGWVPRGGLYFCERHYMEHLRDAHGYTGEQAATTLAKWKSVALGEVE